MRRMLWVLVAVLSLAISLPAAPGQGKGKGSAKGKPEAGEKAEKGKKPEAGEEEHEKGKGKEKEKEKREKEDQERERQAAQGRAFGKKDERAIRAWFANPTNRQGLPPGLAKREQLPPGLQRQLQRNGTLPPGLQNRVQPLPQSLESQLPKPPAGVKRVVVAGNVILLEERTSKILDIVENVMGGSSGRSEPGSTGVRRNP